MNALLKATVLFSIVFLSSSTPLNANLPQVSGAVGDFFDELKEKICDSCQDFWGKVKDAVGDVEDFNESIFKKAVEQTCELVTDNVIEKLLCQTFGDATVHTVFEFISLEKKIDPKDICVKVKSCSS